MIDCLEFRRQVGADPSLAGGEIDAHRQGCAACARYQDELRSMDGLIARALAVDLTGAAPARAADRPRGGSRYLALAASLVAAIGVGVVLWTSAPRDSVAREVIDHVRHEPGATAGVAPIAPGALAGVLDPESTRLKPGIGDVTFAARCVFDGRIVPHLVVRTGGRAYTVLLLRHRQLQEPVRFAQEGYAGVVLPAPRGAIAIVDAGDRIPDAVATRVFAAVDWGR